MSKYANYRPARGTVAGYTVGANDIVSPTEIIISDDDHPLGTDGLPLTPDGTERILLGWRFSRCESFAGGRVLVALRR